ncbi:MAG: flagellar accessory protein FlaH [Caldilineaceae bacterium]|nr:flagellar accessory protein FlaH [Caldilineaceae bacterium]
MSSEREATVPSKVISTGSREIDDKMGGGVPHGSMTLIEGDSNSGKSVLTQQMSWGSLHDGFRLSFFTTENTVKSLVKQMNSLNIDIVDYLLLGRLRLFPMEISQSRAETLNVLLQALKTEGARGSDMIVVDALTPCITSSPPEAVLTFFEKCKRLCSAGMTIVIVVHSHAVDKELLVRVTSLCDAHLRLRTEEVGERLVKAMEVAKVRGASKRTGNIISFEVEPGFGMRIIPINKAQG